MKSNGRRVQLKILLPSGIFSDVKDVTRIVAMTPAGSFGLLPHRLDCATALVPGLLSYSTATSDEVHLAVDAGVMVKTGAQVLVCVRQAVAGTDLGRLHQVVDHEMKQLSEQEKSDRAALTHLEAGLVRRLVELQRD